MSAASGGRPLFEHTYEYFTFCFSKN